MRISQNKPAKNDVDASWKRGEGKGPEVRTTRGLPWGLEGGDARGRAGASFLRGRQPWSNAPWANFLRQPTIQKEFKRKLDRAEARAIPHGTQPPPNSRTATFTPEEVARVRNAPDAKSAAREVRAILQKETGKQGRDALNKVLGTNIRSGPNKNRAANRILDELSRSVAKTLRSDAGAAAAVDGGHAAAGRSAWSGDARPGYGDDAGVHAPSAPPADHCVEQPVTVDLSDFVDAGKSAADLISPLIFDLEGRGLQLAHGHRVPVNLEGDEQDELVTNPDNGLGLLTFDARIVDDDGDSGVARSLFGDGTDLTGYGVRSPRADGRWDDGFAALRALCEHLYLVQGDKQHLDAQDIAFLQVEVGLRMRTGGLHGEDHLLSDLGVTRLQLGAPAGVEPLEQAPRDRFGNKWMHQTGATFTVHSVERAYADLWFAVTQRTAAQPTKRNAATSAPSAAPLGST